MKNKTTKDKITNYVLTIIFVILLVGFFGTLISISKYVSREDDNHLINDHLGITKDLIEDVNEVEMSVNKLTKDTTQIDDSTYNSFKGLENLIEVSYVNARAQKEGIMNLVFDSEIQKSENIFYLEYQQKSPINIGDIIVFKTENSITQYGKLFVEENDELGIYLDITKEIVFIKENEVLGKFLMEFDNNLKTN